MEKKISVFLDSNVMFSMAYSGKDKSRSYILIDLKMDGILSLYSSELAVNEAMVNLKEKKPEALKEFEKILRHLTVVEDLHTEINSPLIAELTNNDRVLLLTAVQNGIDFFITGNARDFKNLYHKKINNTLILTPSDFLHKNF